MISSPLLFSIAKKKGDLLGRLLSIDYGKARVGFAYSDERKLLASPWQTFARTTPFNEIKKKLSFLEPLEFLVVGLPLLLNGKEGEMAQEARIFGEALASYLQIPCLFWDERLSSAQAERLMQEGSLSRKKRASLSDTFAATLILQNYLDFQRDRIC